MRTALALTLGLFLASPAFAKSNLGKKAKLAAAAKVSLADATTKAAAKGKPFEAELLEKHGKAVWEFEVVGDDGKVAEVDVDADSGEVIDSEKKK